LIKYVDNGKNGPKLPVYPPIVKVKTKYLWGQKNKSANLYVSNRSQSQICPTLSIQIKGEQVE